MKFKTWLAACCVSFCIGFGTVAALVTTYLDASVLLELVFFCFCFCAMSSWLFCTKKGSWILLGLTAAFLGYLFWAKELWSSALSLAYQLSVFFNKGYGWGVLPVPAWQSIVSPLTALKALMLIPALSVSWSVCRQKRLLLTLPLALIPLYPCFVLTDMVPERWCISLILTGVLVLVLTQTLRRRSHADGNRLTALVLIPAVLASTLLLNKIPQEGLWEHFPSFQELSYYLPTLNHGPGNTVSAPGMPTNDRVELSTAGPQSENRQQVMTVMSNFDGFLYLRYQAFDNYDGSHWTVSQLREAPLCWPEASALKLQGRIQITTRQNLDSLFIPYYPHSGSYSQLQNGKLPNREGLTQYSYAIAQLRSDLGTAGDMSLNRWLSLPQDTQKAAKQFLQEHGLKTPQQIVNFVQTCATYSLQTPKMPAGEKDFAIWFLKNAETGYCMHFATAATVLLRAAGYPARYVTGYAVQTASGEAVSVTKDMAHAWVEYLEPEGAPYWQVLEPTPGIAPEETPEVPTTVPEETTQPTQSTAPPEPTAQDPQNTEQTEPSVSEPVTTPSTVPETPGGSSVDLSWLWSLLRSGALLAAAVLSIWAQRRIRIRLRLRKQNAGHWNVRALARWQEICRLCRLLKEQPPENMLELAEKARFSQHTITREELFCMGQFLQQQRRKVDTLPAWKRFFLRLIWAV